MRQQRLRHEAWIGDAVLELFACERVSLRTGSPTERNRRALTSNRFLSAFGEPTAVEAEVGRIYRDQGLSSAFDRIESRLIPLFERQESNRRPRLSHRSRMID